MPLLSTGFNIIVKPLTTSCKIRHLRKICYFTKHLQLSTCLFLSSYLNIWPNPWWIFGIFAIFAEICLFALICHFPIIPLFTRRPFLSCHLNFANLRWFRQRLPFRKKPQSTTWFFCHLVLIFAISVKFSFFHLNLPFSYHCHLRRFLFLTSFEFLSNSSWILANCPFSQICHFLENRQLSICLFCCLI